MKFQRELVNSLRQLFKSCQYGKVETKPNGENLEGNAIIFTATHGVDVLSIQVYFDLVEGKPYCKILVEDVKGEFAKEALTALNAKAGKNDCLLDELVFRNTDYDFQLGGEEGSQVFLEMLENLVSLHARKRSADYYTPEYAEKLENAYTAIYEKLEKFL